ncbi:phospholipid-binding lipoprotein MlaA [Desulfovibrio gilichinskyi]|uniref:Phospholipid-binding lipoprotein MlaA n=2 Tax=Desulfovibrio gilichinskyi TaxID=1519643 RepID=A0A1X7E4L1_9BACT|nr:phospholipid-binding lipoprotein MlaA [Desulfovibrio gilichinskyi]
MKKTMTIKNSASNALLAFLVLTFILLTFPSQVRSAQKNDQVLVAQVGSGVIGADKSEDQTAAGNDDFNDDIWGDTLEAKDTSKSDPWEGYNRAMFSFNDFMYFEITKPVTQGYMYVMPLRPRTWINNFFQNMLTPVRVTSCLLQGKFFTAGAETSKFVANTVVGLGGLGDVIGDRQSTMPLYLGNEDMGQTFGVWGIPNGPYFVIPVLGPSTVRDAVGLGIDTFALNPFWWFGIPWYYSLSAGAYNQINKLSFHLGEYESLKEGAIDPYAALKDAYLQYRARQLHDKKKNRRPAPASSVMTDPNAQAQTAQ